MDIPTWIAQAKDLGISALSRTSNVLGSGMGFVKSTVGRLWLYGSTAISTSYDADRVDEKHYFLVPDRRSPVQYSLYVMRCLPQGIPPLNDLPKRRLFHLPNDHAIPTVEHILLEDARKGIDGQSETPKTISSRLNDIADQIDRLDGQLFNGVLLIGGLVALVNPVAGALVAMKALMPSIGLLLSKHGLKYAGETLQSYEMTKRIKSAEKEVLRQFRGSGTDSIVNPLLAQLDRALETTECEYDPILEFDSERVTFGQRDRTRLITLTCQAIVNTYDEIVDHPQRWAEARLGPEDVRFLKLLRQLADLSQE